ncbi:hypothetical protein ACE01N_16495 [Saccharicrinis sp. FJH2]|uniref:hypothetical protein n=1 Tax=Saccharicrinis sp. FJH65 TaxID=3344659 RepID=UPI0035F40E12
MKKRSLFLGLSLLLAVLPFGSMNAQFAGSDNDFYLASNIEIQPIEVNDSKSSSVASEESESALRLIEEPGKMVMYYSEDVLTLSYVNSSRGRVFFSVNDEDGNMLYSKYFKDEPMVHSRVLMNKLPDGEYVAVLRTDKDLIRKSFVINQ